ncbi:hypothetical protein PINS_up014189 [Pythium insidiosum]|nr:hypothetical protein PINS_up014189 [Pythium insidiosum]
MAAVEASASQSPSAAPSADVANASSSVSPSKSPSKSAPTARKNSLAREFARHVALDDGVLATSAPLDLKQLDRVLLLTAEALAPLPDICQRAQEIRERLMTERYGRVFLDRSRRGLTEPAVEFCAPLLTTD